MKKTLLSLAVTATLGLASAAASAVELMDFKVQEGSVPGAFSNLITADKITGNYNEVISFDGLGGFISKIYWDAGQFVGNDGANVQASQLGAGLFGQANQYQSYALMTATGVVTGTAGTGFTFAGTSAAIDWFIDTASNTTKALPSTAAGSVLLGNTADDYLIASSSTLLNGEGHIFPGGGANGDFQIVFKNLTLTTGDNSGLFAGDQNGDEFFISPRPFYVNLETTGQLNSFAPIGTQTINGSADVTFVPEPGVLGLMGLGLIGLAASSRRRRLV